jgi:hypothetical protein
VIVRCHGINLKAEVKIKNKTLIVVFFKIEIKIREQNKLVQLTVKTPGCIFKLPGGNPMPSNLTSS